MGALSSSETSVNFCQTTTRHIAEEAAPHSGCCWGLKSQHSCTIFVARTVCDPWVPRHSIILSRATRDGPARPGPLITEPCCPLSRAQTCKLMSPGTFANTSRDTNTTRNSLHLERSLLVEHPVVTVLFPQVTELQKEFRVSLQVCVLQKSFPLTTSGLIEVLRD